MMSKQLTKRRMLAFASADIFGGGSFNVINFVYPGFLAFAMGLSAYWISFILLAARIWDAISDPLMGKISDATKSKYGKRRIYLMIASPLILISFTMMFFPYPLSSTAARVLAALGSYLLFCTVQTMVMIPYYSLSSEISPDFEQRAKANSYRLGFSIFSSILCVAVPGMIVDAFKPGNNGYIVMGLVFGFVFAVAVLITGLFSREEITSEPIKSKFRLSDIKKYFSVAPFRQYLGMLLATQMTMAIMSGLFFFFIDFYICRDLTAAGESNMTGLIGAAIMFAIQIVALPFYLKVIEKTNKAFTYRLGSYIWILSGLALLFTVPNTPFWVILIFAAVMGFGISGPGLVPHTMFGDVVDAVQLRYNERNDGFLSGMVNFTSKVAQAVGLALVMALLGVFGFVEQEYGSTVAILTQPESAQIALKLIMGLSPLICMGLGSLVSSRYKIDKKEQSRIASELGNDTSESK